MQQQQYSPDCLFSAQGEMMCPKTPSASKDGIFDNQMPPEKNPEANTFRTPAGSYRMSHDKALFDYYVQPTTIISHFDKSCSSRVSETI